MFRIFSKARLVKNVARMSSSARGMRGGIQPVPYVIDPDSGKRVVASFNEAASMREGLRGSTCMLPISLGAMNQPIVRSPHTGTKFAATLQLLKTLDLNKVIIMLDDSIQIESNRIFLNPTEALAKTRADLDSWMEETEPLCARILCGTSFEVKHWQGDVEKDDDYLEGRFKISEALAEDPAYAAAFNESIEEFIKRLRGKGVSFDEGYARKQCMLYLIYECAGMAFVWTKWGVDFEIYPSGRNSAMAATYDKFINPVMLRSLSLRFSKRNIDPSIAYRDILNDVESPAFDSSLKL